jgi:hypothetical protein
MRWLRRIGIGLLVLLLTVGIGRLVQKALQSRYSGERTVYLQQLGTDTVTLHWQSGEAEVGEVRFGTSAAGMDQMQREAQTTTRHAVRLPDLRPDTRYWYSVGATSETPVIDANRWFRTAPPVGSSGPTRIWVQGDPGYWYRGSEAVRDAAITWSAARPRPGRPPFDLWLTTGDNAYGSGKNSEFQSELFAPYARLLGNVPYWPAYGNHDARRWAFFEIFDFPQHGELGGIASGTEHYFAFNHANIHLVFLDTETGDLDSDGAMLQWLRRDLDANRQHWSIVVLHHPPYTKGSHDSDSEQDSWGRMAAVRAHILPILEAHNVDLVLAGHSHVYERSYLLACHYGHSATLQPAMILDRGNLFAKSSARDAGAQGTVYAVVGSSAKADQGPLDHPAMAIARSQLGSLLIDVEGNRLDAYFITDSGTELDRFSIRKDASLLPRERLMGGGCPIETPRH